MSIPIRTFAVAVIFGVAAQAGTAGADALVIPQIKSDDGRVMPGHVGRLLLTTTTLESILTSSPVSTASCVGLTPTKLVISAREQSLTRRQDLSLATLKALSEQVRHRSKHAILGFYAGSVGLLPLEIDVLAGAPADAGQPVPCPHLAIRSELVAMDR